MMKKYLYLLFAIAILATFAACSYFINEPNNEYEYEEPDETDPQPIPPNVHVGLSVQDDGILRLSMRHPLSLNPLLNEDGTVAKILRLLFEPLIIFDENLHPTDNLARMEMASDFTHATLTIRSDAIWSDGIPVSSDDLIFSVEVLRLAPETVIYKRNIENIAQIVRVDSRTVQIVFVKPSMTASYALNFPIIPEHYFRGHNNLASPRNMEPLGNGPYRFESLHPMQMMTLVRNEYSFRRSQIEEINVLLIPDAETTLHAFNQGRIDAIRLPFSEWVKHHSVKPVHHEEFPAMYFEFIGFNFQRDIFKSEHIRRGIAQAFDADEAMNAVYLHQAVRAVSPIHPYSWMHDDTIVGPGFNPGQASVALRAVDTDEPLEILVNTEHIERVHIAQRLATSLNAVGLPAQVVRLPFDEYHQRLMYGEFDLFMGGMQLDFAPNFAFMFQGRELFGVDLVMEGLSSALYAQSTETAFLRAVSQLQQGFVDRLPIISLGFRHSSVITGTRISQNHPPSTDHIFASINESTIR